MLKTVKITGLTAAVAAFVAVSATALPTNSANAQDPYGQAQEQMQHQQPQISEHHLEAFIAAEQDVRTLQMQFQQQAGTVSSQEEMQQLQQQAHTQMAQAIESNGLDVDTYNTIANAVQTDPAIRSQYSDMVAE
ncbi:MAG: DUF4168 domain-containing protein [Micavibrio sp.]|nr:MAG: DUF4168 domain-containing protein [Micavibrio sp.]